MIKFCVFTLFLTQLDIKVGIYDYQIKTPDYCDADSINRIFLNIDTFKLVFKQSRQKRDYPSTPKPNSNEHRTYKSMA
ncbi:hypothetical protein NQ317_018587 [Molorchus minor]|uniref:Uncharacterized protein n=1 Tax=Molorchus minor TaxID=1323400 RepID=A0ABQ9IYS7_9CUCU|nr:hypothetical protein NQ317_018587 [Molorchus minor]